MREHRLPKAFLIIVFILGIFLSFSPAIASTGDDPLAKIVAGIGSNETTLEISNQQDITADLTIPSTLTLQFNQGGTLNITAAKTVTINGHVDAGLYQIFEGAGTVAFGSGSVKEVYPEWWGENTTPGTTDMATEIQAAIDSLSVGGTVFISAGTMRTTARINYKDKVRIVGAGRTASIIYYTGNDYAVLMGGSDLGNPIYELSMANLQILGTSSAVGGIKLYATALFDFENVKIIGFTQHVPSDADFDAGYGIHFYDSVVLGSLRACYIRECHIGIYSEKVTSDTFNAVSIEGQSEIAVCDYAIVLGDPEDGAAATPSGNHSDIVNSTIQGNTYGGIWNVDVYELSMAHNYFEANGEFSIRIGGTEGNLLYPRHNIVFANRFSDETVAGISLDIQRSKWTQVKSNYFNAGHTAINIAGAGSRTWMSFNRIADTNYTNSLVDNGFANIYEKHEHTVVADGYKPYRYYDAYLHSAKTLTPTETADTTGAEGWITWDDDYAYIKTSTGWKRVSLSAWEDNQVIFVSAAPVSGSARQGNVYWNTGATAGGSPGWVCVHSGTFGAATDNTGDTDGSTAVITGMTDTSDFSVNDYVDVSAGFPTTGPYRVVALTATTMTLEVNSDAAVANITVDTSDPTFKAMANLVA